ncbi:hypothetical protein J3R83DRAFT_12521 [Lanmaoa asiatica]|nr:hypothetical protein J3R83DRAFT_12521 [Lanmaoa asiatica]
MSPGFDIIFAGGGTTACVIAGRLAAADPSLKILVVESDQHSRNLPIHVQPCRFVEHQAPRTTILSTHVGKPSTHLNGRTAAVRCGRCVGGGSAVNFMLYVRGATSDYDDWEAFGNKGWGFDEVLPLIKKLRTFTPISGRPTHGYSGPIQISAGGTDLGIGNQFLNVARAYDPARPQVDDSNDFKVANAYSLILRWPQLYRPRDWKALRCCFSISISAFRPGNIIYELTHANDRDGHAVGIEYMTEAMSCQAASDELVTVKATKLVVVSAGAFGSPSILERSGIGAPSVLRKNNIHVLVDLPGVGENYQDHWGSCPAFYASDKTETMDDVWTDPEAITGERSNRTSHIKFIFHHSGIEAMVKVRPTAEQLTSIGPTLQLRWETFFQHSPDKPMVRHPCTSSIALTLAFELYPESIGSVHITSGEDANSPLDFDPDICSKAGDVAQLTLLYKMTRELARRMPAYRGEVAAYHPKFPHVSPAACRESDDPVPIDAPDIVYSDTDDEAIAKFHRDTVFATWHSLGTCAMKPRNKGGVVDARLNVYSVEGLKVADLSICPTNVGNNSCSTALLIGEKAAAIIAEDLGMKM